MTPWAALLTTRLIQEIVTFTCYSAFLVILFKVPVINQLTTRFNLK